MKQLKCIFIFLLGLTGCQGTDELLFDDVARVQMKGNTALIFSFVSLPSSVTRDTVMLPVNVSGGLQDRFRKIRFVQITEYEVTYVKDNNGYVIDSTVMEITNKAVPGVHYVAFDDAEMDGLLGIRPGEVSADIPVILLRDSSLETQKFRLGVKLEVSDDFQLGEKIYLNRTIEFSDQLDKPTSWRGYNEMVILGSYSVVKHRFMIDVLKMPINNDWLAKERDEILYMRDKCSKALLEFNKDPEKIASGEAPILDENDKVLTFPSSSF